ncbi:hypothetical protein ACKWTF_012559 [Chironomus riparius]
MSLLFIITVLLAFYFTYYLFQIKRERKNCPPGPLGNYIPFIGYLPFLNPAKPHETLLELSKKYGNIFSLQMGSIFTVILADSALIREAFRRDEFSGRAPLFVTHGIFNGYGLICTEGEFWKDQRSLVHKWLRDMGMIKFGIKRELMQNRIMEGIDLYIQEIEKLQSHKINPLNILMDTVGNIVNDFVFGMKYEWNSDTWKYLKHLQEEGVKLVGIHASANFLPILRFLPSNRRNMEFILTGKAATHKLYDAIVDNCERALDTSTEYRDCILKRFLLEKRDREQSHDELAKNCSREQLNHLLADMFGASLDTTLCTLRWYLLLIAIHHECQDKIYEEMRNYGIRERYLTDDIESLPYLKASIAESMRLKTVVPCGIPHGNTQQHTTLDGYFIPKNSMILPLQYAIHMNENLWPEPQTFNPNRFIDEDGKFFTSPNFIPFQTGKR